MSASAASFFDLTLSVQIALGAGYLAYVTCYAGFRADHKPVDQVSISLVFSSFALVVANLCHSLPDIWKVVVTLIATLVLGVLWRTLGRPVWHWTLEKTGVHRDDGIHTGWAALVQTNKLVSQATIYTTDDMEFHLANRAPYLNEQWKGLYLCGDGSVTMIVDTETDASGEELQRTTQTDEEYGTRFTHFPASQIRRVELRMK
jgi:hypothetical protein